MLSRVQIELQGPDWAGELLEGGDARLNEPAAVDGETLDIFVWEEGSSQTQIGAILEAHGNRTVKLTGKYRFRYDPPRSASTGSGQVPAGDCHLYDGSDEIAAWDGEGKARHGFKAGHRLPKKAYDTIVARFPSVHGLKGRLL